VFLKFSWKLGDTSYADIGSKEITDGFIWASQYVVTIIVIYGFLAIVPSQGFIMTVIGQRTLYVYLLHGFIIKTIQTIVSDDTLTGISDHYLTLTVFSLGVCVLLGNYLIQKYTRPLIELRL